VKAGGMQGSHDDFFLDLNFDPEDGGDMFF
jgi:hypothetical protein